MFETILALTIIFVTATIMLVLFNRLGQPPITAYIITGVATGFLLDEILLLDLVQLGILFLTFIFGVKSGADEVIKNIHYGLQATLGHLAIIFPVAFGAAYLLGFDYLNATYFSIAAALSSTLVGSEYSIDLKELNVVYRRISESVNTIEDFFAILIILIISIIPISIGSVGISLLYGLLIIMLSYLVRQAIFPWLVKMVKGSSEFVMLIGLSILFGFVGIAVYLEISILVGAFAAGMALSKHPYEIKVLDTMGSLMEFFSIIFFVTLGALLVLPDLNVVSHSLAIIVVTIIIKPTIITQLLIWQGYNKRTAINTALQLDHVSEFALMIAIQASLMGLIETALFNAIVVSAVITMTLSSYTSEYGNFIYHQLSRYIFTKKEQRDGLTLYTDGLIENHIIVVGYGVKGQMIVELLKARGQLVLVIENDPILISRLQTKRCNYLFADAEDTLTWQSAFVDKARLVIVTAPKLQISEAALGQETSADIMVSSYDMREATYLLRSGAIYVFITLYLAREPVERAIKNILDGNPSDIRKENQKLLQEQSQNLP
ncbi:MAG: cation:proton antiporter [Balneolales bacterium]